MDKDEVKRNLSEEISNTDWKEKEKLNLKHVWAYLVKYGSLKSGTLIFMINLTSDGEEGGLCHDYRSTEIRDPITCQIRSWRAGIFGNNQDLMFQSQPKQVNHQKWQLSLFDTYDRQGNDGKKDNTKYTNCLLQNMKRMAVWRLYWRRFRTRYRQAKSKRNGTSRSRWALQFQSSYRRLRWVRSEEDFYEKD